MLYTNPGTGTRCFVMFSFQVMPQSKRQMACGIVTTLVFGSSLIDVLVLTSQHGSVMIHASGKFETSFLMIRLELSTIISITHALKIYFPPKYVWKWYVLGMSEGL